MRGTLKVNHLKAQIVMNRVFASAATNTISEEYAHLQQVRKDYPTYQVLMKTIKRNSDKKTYHGLTYKYMMNYIKKYPKPELGCTVEQFSHKLAIAECQGTKFRYPVVKKWFLECYPEIAEFGLEDENTPEAEQIPEELKIAC